MKTHWRQIVLLIALVLTLGIGAMGGMVIDREWLNPPATQDGVGINAHLLQEAWNTIQQKYVDRPALQPERLTYGAIGGLVDALGDTDHSRFLTPEMVKEEDTLESGQFEGIGAEVSVNSGHVTIVAPLDDSPAQRADLRPGDIIAKVDGQDVSGLPLSDVVNRILGPAGTPVTLTILDPNTGEARDVTLQRARITLHNVTWQQLPGTTIAHVRVASFSRGVTSDLQQALREVQQHQLTGVILDLRNNPGGLLDEAVGTASQFLKDGNVLQEKNAQGEVTPVPVRSGGVATQLPLVVLINNGTASAAEIVAGALQDAQRAELVGEATIGTGTVLNRFSLSDGSALLLAVEEWLTPKGRVIWHHGITPDLKATLALNVTPLTPEAERNMTADQLKASGDQPLLRAMSLLGPSTAGGS
jgi:carboxyl-terminal processing protease